MDARAGMLVDIDALMQSVELTESPVAAGNASCMHGSTSRLMACRTHDACVA